MNPKRRGISMEKCRELGLPLLDQKTILGKIRFYKNLNDKVWPKSLLLSCLSIKFINHNYWKFYAERRNLF